MGYQVFYGASPYAPLAPAPGLSFADLFGPQNAASIGYLPFWPIVTALMYGFYSVVGSGNRFAYYFLLKQPAILGDLMVGYLLYRYVASFGSDRASWSLKVWLFAPLTIIVSSMWGMFDALAMGFVLLAVSAESHTGRSVLSGFATFIKSIPVLFSIPLTFRDGRRWLGTALAFLLPALLSVAVVAYEGWQPSLVRSGVTSTAFKAGESMSFFDILYLLPILNLLPSLSGFWLAVIGLVWIPAVFVATLWALRRFGSRDTRSTVQVMLAVTLVFLVFKAQVNEQYSLYLLPLAIIDIAIWNPDRRQLLLWTFFVATAYLVVNNVFLIRFVAPLVPEAAALDATLSHQLDLLRIGTKFVLGAAFTGLNLLYLRRLAGSAQTNT